MIGIALFIVSTYFYTETFRVNNYEKLMKNISRKSGCIFCGSEISVTKCNCKSFSKIYIFLSKIPYTKLELFKCDSEGYRAAGIMLYNIIYEEGVVKNIEFLMIKEKRKTSNKYNFPGGKREMVIDDIERIESSHETAYFEFVEELVNYPELIEMVNNSVIKYVHWSPTSKCAIYLIKTNTEFDRFKYYSETDRYVKIFDLDDLELDGEEIHNFALVTLKDIVEIGII